MGSLMSGWSSTVLGDDKRVRLMRNRSLTKEEVDAFWRQRGRPEPDNGQESPPFEARRLDGNRSLPSPLGRGSNGGQHFASHSEPSSPVTRRAEGFTESSAAADRPSTSCDWWTRSSWAFLNEPPHRQEEASMSGRGRAHKAYACDQFHVAPIVTGNA